MQGENEKLCPKNETNGCDDCNGSNPNACASPVVAGGNSAAQSIAAQTSEKSSSDSFYERLSKFYESSGLSLVFNFRETSLDLYLFYKEVTERGGFHQVTKNGKWCEVESALDLKNRVSLLPTQLEKLYANLLHQFEQLYYYRTPAKVTADPGDSSGCSTGKRMRCDSFPLSTGHSGDRDGPVEKRNCNNNSFQLPTGPITAAPKLPLQTPSKNKKIKKDPNAPRGLRTGYQIFLKKECDRLKKIYGESSGSQNIRDMAIDAWRCLSESDRQPYIEASRKDKERFKKEMAAYKECKDKQNPKTQNWSSSSKPNIINFGMPSQTDGDYHVILQPNAESFFVPDESLVESAIQLMKNARPNDPIFQISWDEYCGSLDISS